VATYLDILTVEMSYICKSQRGPGTVGVTLPPQHRALRDRKVAPRRRSPCLSTRTPCRARERGDGLGFGERGELQHPPGQLARPSFIPSRAIQGVESFLGLTWELGDVMAREKPPRALKNKLRR
jgi:hypothetical protein